MATYFKAVRVLRGPRAVLARWAQCQRSKLTDAQVQEVRARSTGARGEQTLMAREYGVTSALISLIMKGAYR